MRHDTQASNLPKINSQIKAVSVRLINTNGNMVGVVPLETALQTAAEEGLDLVEISPKASPPVCKIIDFGKYKYEIKRNLQKAKKKQKVIELKEVRLRPSIGAHDLDIKINQIRGFIAKGKKVKVSMRFRGREITYFALGKEVFEKLVAKVSDIAEPESAIKTEKAYITAVLIEKTKEV